MEISVFIPCAVTKGPSLDPTTDDLQSRWKLRNRGFWTACSQAVARLL